MIELETAVERILALILPPAPESIPLTQAHCRVLAERLASPVDLPGFDNSSVDGYAVRAGDVQSARADAPVALRLVGRVAAGEIFPGRLAAGQCVRIFTGAALPAGTDAVVMQEDTRAPAPDAVEVLDAAKPWDNVRFRGGDVHAADIIGDAGDDLTAARLTLLAACGTKTLQVGRQPIVGLLAAGSELLEAGQPLSPGKIHESNRTGLAVLISQAGGVPRLYPLVPDSLADTRAALERAFRECDFVVTTGGVSVGETDFIKGAFEELGGELDFWKVAIRPGRPFVCGRWQGKLLFGLPGNPVSAFVTFLLLARPALRRWQGARLLSLPTHPGILAEPLSNAGNRRHFIRVHVDSSGKTRATGLQESHALASLAAANGLVDVPPNTTLPAGASVSVLRWGE